MAIYIKGMEMPKGCEECPFCVAFLYKQQGVCTAYNPPKEEHVLYKGTNPSVCPLIEVPEPHGRLIDARMLEKDLAKRWDVNDDQDFCNKEVWYALDDAPTVIEGSE